MTDHQITPEQVRKIEAALEERTPGAARRKKPDPVAPTDTERREKGPDRRKDND